MNQMDVATALIIAGTVITVASLGVMLGLLPVKVNGMWDTTDKCIDKYTVKSGPAILRKSVDEKEHT
jgi:hypothetical protein